VTLYFLTLFLQRFILYTSCLTIAFTMGNVFMRLPGLLSFSAVLVASTTMLPIIMFFVLPLSVGMAVSSVITKSLANCELLAFRYIKKALISLQTAVAFFSLASTLLYIPIVMHWGPQGYFLGKKAIMDIAKTDLLSLPSKVFHKLSPEFCFRFESKEKHIKKYKNIFLSLQDNKSNTHYAFNAESCSTNDYLINLQKGTLNIIRNNTLGLVDFDALTVNIDALINPVKKEGHKAPKLCTAAELYKEGGKQSLNELFKRLFQILWIALISFLAFFTAFSLSPTQHVMIRSMSISCALYGIMHIVTTISCVFERYFPFNVILLLLITILIMAKTYFFYRKRL
jgi:hypothetical protein